jgi:small-conductance mechanosensitive channel
MGLFKKRTDPDEMARLRAEIERMGARLAAADAEKREFHEQLQRLNADVEQQASRITATPAEASLDELREQLLKLDRRIDEQLVIAAGSPGVDAAAVETLRETVERLSQRFDVPLTEAPAPPPPPPETDLADMSRELGRLAERLDDVERRIVSISKELAHQIDELGSEIHAGDGAPPSDAVDELRRAQVDLAAEQARYQIAFREELAQLADRLR